MNEKRSKMLLKKGQGFQNNCKFNSNTGFVISNDWQLIINQIDLLDLLPNEKINSKPQNEKKIQK